MIDMFDPLLFTTKLQTTLPRPKFYSIKNTTNSCIQLQ